MENNEDNKNPTSDLQSRENTADADSTATQVADKAPDSPNQPDPVNAVSGEENSKPFIQGALESAYAIFYLLGLQSFRYSKRYLLRLGRFFMQPVRYLWALLKVFVMGLDRIFLHSLRSAQKEASVFKQEALDSFKYIRKAFKQSPASIFSIIRHYIAKSFKSHRQMLKTFINFGLPLAALAMFWLTVSYWSGITYSLKLDFEDKGISFVQNEGVYIKARSMANEKLGDTGKVAANYMSETEPTKGSQKSDAPLMGLALVKLNQLTDEGALFDSLIEDNRGNMTNACGIFVDGNFIGAVKNETDATGVFENLLEPYKTDDPGTFVSFVEDVELTQGLYPAGTKIMAAGQLKDLLKGTKTQASYYEATADDTYWSISIKNGISVEALAAMNPERTSVVHKGDSIKVSNEVNYLRVKVVKTESRTVDVDYETVKVENPNLFKGSSKIIRQGKKGQEKVTELVSYVDGIRVSANEVDRVRIKEPQDERVSVGSKPTTVYSKGGSYNVKVSKEGWVWPVPALHTVSSPFGYRSRGFHNGIDISGSGNANGKIIVAARDGVVESAGYNGSWGNLVVINHGGGLKSGYAHCLNGSISVRPGQRVSAGQAIARVGSTGNSTGPHLHFFITVNGKYVNPLPYVR